MNNKKNSKFVEKILKEKLNPPTHRHFSIDKWRQEWLKTESEATDRDHNVYQAGLIINSLLSEIREQLADLYKRLPKITYERLMLAFISLSNREVTVALKQFTSAPSADIYSAMLKANPSGSSFSFQEIAHSAVDGLQLAIRECQRKAEKLDEIKASENPINDIEFILKECYLSQLYASYTNLWQCVIWSDYKLSKICNESNIYSITQPFTPHEFAFESSAIRQNKLNSQKLLIAESQDLREAFSNDKLVVIKRKNKKKIAAVVSVRNCDDKIIVFNNQWRIDVLDLLNFFPTEWLTNDYEKGFCISEAFEVMRCLKLMACISQMNFPDDDRFYGIDKLLEFCPKVHAASLRIAISRATDICITKVSKILQFMTATSSDTSDLWCEPLIKTKKNEYAILVSALAHPNIVRLVEHWIRAFGIPLDKKGYRYEETVIAQFNSTLKANELIKDYDQGLSKRIRLSIGEEEFDLIARIDDLIIIGECKCIVTTDSQISKYRTAEILEHAGKQIERKILFLKNNIESVFKVLGWRFDNMKEYKITGCIINSGRIFVGHKFNDIPVIDEIILTKYFETPKIRIFSIPSENGEVKDCAWYILYNNFQELKDNFSIYLTDPPQLIAHRESFEYNDIKLPCLSKDSFKIIQRRLVMKEMSSHEIINGEHMFQLFKCEDYEQIMSNVQVLV